MREHRLPDPIRTDNGSPFETTGPLGLSKLGLLHERLQPGEPGENGRHERMHRTLKLETATPPAFTLREPQARFDNFEEGRRHEARRKAYLSAESLSHERIGLLLVEDQLYELYLGDTLLGEVDTHWMTFTSVR